MKLKNIHFGGARRYLGGSLNVNSVQAKDGYEIHLEGQVVLIREEKTGAVYATAWAGCSGEVGDGADTASAARPAIRRARPPGSTPPVSG